MANSFLPWQAKLPENHLESMELEHEDFLQRNCYVKGQICRVLTKTPSSVVEWVMLVFTLVIVRFI